MIPHSRPWIRNRDIEAVVSRLHTHCIAEGDLTAELEQALARRYGFADAIVVGSGSQALFLALKAIGVVPGMPVVLPTYVCPELLGILDALDAETVIADVGDDYQLDPFDQRIRHASSGVVILPSLFGRRARCSVALPKGASIVHDWAHFLPQANHYRDVEIATLSFAATKALAAGEGGALLVRNSEQARHIRNFKALCGSKYEVNLYPFSDLQAALALSQLASLDEMIGRRVRIAGLYLEVTKSLASVSVMTPSADDVPFRLPMQLTKEGMARFPGGVTDVIAAFASRGIAVRRPVADLLHHVRPNDQPYPTAERLFAATFSLPLYPGLADAEVDCIIAAMKEIL